MSWFRLRYSIGHEGWSYLLIAAFVLVGSVFRDINLLILLVGMMAGPFLFNWRMVTLAVKRIQASRRIPQRVCAGDLLTVELRAMTRRLPFGIWAVSVQDSVRPADESQREEPSQVTSLIARIPSNGVGRASYRCLLTRRGRYRFGPFVISTRFPFGLVRASRRVECDQYLLVCPRIGRLTSTFADAVESERAGSRHAQPRRGLVDGDYYALREWRSGDSQRWIHWRTSAKMNELIVREFEEHRHRDVALVVDLWRPVKADDEDFGRVELALSFAATVVTEICQRGSKQLTIALAGNEVHVVNAPTSPQLVQDLMDRMATIVGSTEPPLNDAVPSLMGNLRGDSRLVMVTTRGDRMERLRREAQVAAGDRRIQRAVQDAVWLDVSSPTFSNYFQID